MNTRTIELFMWEYQHSFRISLEIRAKHVFERVGIGAEPTIVLVGVRRPDVADVHPVCIEPEEGRWTLDMFENLEALIEQRRAEHPDRLIFHSHPHVAAAQPERILRDAIGEAVREALNRADADFGLQTFCSAAVPVEGHYIVCALQVPQTALTQYPTISYEWLRRTGETNFALRTIDALLDEARRALHMPDAQGEDMRTAEEIGAAAAGAFMRVSVIPDQWVMTDAFRLLNQLSQLPYEGLRGTGRLVFAAENDPRISYTLRFAEPVSLRNVLWIRKLLEMSNEETPLIGSYEQAFGLGTVQNEPDPVFHVDFVDRHEWLYKRDDVTLLHCRFGEPTLPRDAVNPDQFDDTLIRMFAGISPSALKLHHATLLEMTRQPHGSMIVIAADAEGEALRLANQGTRIAPTVLTPALLNRASKIDGTILVSPDGICHAIGVILDGEAHPACTPSRGARFNSGIRYVGTGEVSRIVLVMSEDRTLDVIPLLRPQMSRRTIEKVIAALEAATTENFYKPRNRLDELRFYLSQTQCDRINAALDRLNDIPLAEFELRFIGPRFEPNPVMNDSYLVD